MLRLVVTAAAAVVAGRRQYLAGGDSTMVPLGLALWLPNCFPDLGSLSLLLIDD